MQYLWMSRNWWRELENTLGGTYHHSMWRDRRRLVVDRGRTRVSIAVQHSVQFARFEAPFLLPVGPRLSLLPQGTFRMWMRQFGYQDIEIGDAAFDLRFIVKGEPERDVRAVLSKAADALTTLEPSPTVSANHEGVTLSGAQLVNLDWQRWVDATALLATADLYGLDVLTSLPDSQVRWPEPPGPPTVTIRVPTPVELSCRADGRSPRTFARARAAADIPSFDVEVGEAHRPPLDLPAGLAGRFRSDGVSLDFMWPGVCRDADEMALAAAALARLAAGRGVAPYR